MRVSFIVEMEEEDGVEGSLLVPRSTGSGSRTGQNGGMERAAGGSDAVGDGGKDGDDSSEKRDSDHSDGGRYASSDDESEGSDESSSEQDDDDGGEVEDEDDDDDVLDSQRLVEHLEALRAQSPDLANGNAPTTGTGLLSLSSLCLMSGIVL